MAEAEAADGGSWQEMMRRILPPGAPIPENLDYSIALVYDGPPVPYDLPRVDPVEIPAEIPTAERASGPHTRGLPVVPVVEPVRLPVSRIARCAEPAAASGGDGSGSANCATRSSTTRTTTRSRRDGSQTARGPGSRDGRRAPVVTFGFTPGNKYGGSGDDMSEQYVAATKQEKRRRRRRMACNRCGKRKWESKEACIVCDARYCGYFVLRMMGWMPEGRKCVTCIGEPLALWLLCADPLVNEFDQIISSSAFKDVHTNTVIFGIHTSTVVDQTQLDCAKSPVKSAISANLESKILLIRPPDDPDCLLRASLVCKTWSDIVFHRAFCRRLHELHGEPPVLGFLHNWNDEVIPCFIPTTASSFSLAAPHHQFWRALDCRHDRAL
ncbi:hypothetical protein ZWY2020_055525 [Hordeum vulgare]|nr:hypothetical protein ZWY2020_055525 [Hordeum vulgare]